MSNCTFANDQFESVELRMKSIFFKLAILLSVNYVSSVIFSQLGEVNDDYHITYKSEDIVQAFTSSEHELVKMYTFPEVIIIIASDRLFHAYRNLDKFSFF